MPDTDIAAAIRSAERIRSAISAAATPDSPAAQQPVTISIGVAAIVPAPPTTAHSLVEAADDQLYRAKRGGRNRVEPTTPNVQR